MTFRRHLESNLLCKQPMQMTATNFCTSPRTLNYFSPSTPWCVTLGFTSLVLQEEEWASLTIPESPAPA